MNCRNQGREGGRDCELQVKGFILHIDGFERFFRFPHAKWSLGKVKEEVRRPEGKLTVFKMVAVKGKVINRFRV